MNIKTSICLILLGFAPAASASMIDTVWAAKTSGFIGVKKSPSGDLTFDGVQNTYLISPVLGSYASP